MYACVQTPPGLVGRSLLAALFLSFTVPGQFDHVVLLLLLLLGEHLLLGLQHELCDAVEHLQERYQTAFTLTGSASCAVKNTFL